MRSAARAAPEAPPEGAAQNARAELRMRGQSLSEPFSLPQPGSRSRACEAFVGPLIVLEIFGSE